jgi:hypothetical protein
MLENPFLTPPQVESSQSRSWAMGFAFGFQGPATSNMTSADINLEDADAFDLGVLAGQDAAINGLALADDPCVDLNVEGPSAPHLAATEGMEGGLVLYALVAGHMAAFVAEGMLLLVTLSIALETFSDDPDVALAQQASLMKSLLAKMGITDSMELFIGGAIDIAQRGCGLVLTPIFRTQRAASDAARNTGRAKWLVISWRTDQSGGVKVVDFSGS